MNFDSLPDEERLWAYNLLDCSYTRIVGEAETSAVNKVGLTAVDAFQHRLFPHVLNTMLRGVRIDLTEKAWLSALLGEELAKREAWLTRVLGVAINPRSPKQMQDLFYAVLKLPIVWRINENGARVPTCNEAALDVLKVKEPLLRPIVKVITEIRTIGVLKSTFVDMTLDYDDRMRTSYNICGAETFRFSSSKNVFESGGNLQNIPVLKGSDNDEEGLDLPNIRTLFIPDEGMTWFDVDLSKADLRTVVWESDETEMKAMLAEGRDPYMETAREYYKKPSLQKTLPDGTLSVEYDNFKKFSHGSHFLGTAEGLAKRIGLTVHEATKAQAWYFGKYQKIKKWQERFVEEVRRTHSVRNKFGYIRHYFGRIDDSTFREAIAWLPQSTTGCVINRIWVNLMEAADDIEVLLQVHDSLDGQFPTERKEDCLAHIRRAGRVVVPYEDPLIIPIGIKTSTLSWGACE